MKADQIGAGLTAKRLTWDAAFPAPYESIWSILIKVSVFNNVTLNELIRLIGRKNSYARSVTSINCAETNWIDFEILSALLGVSIERLTCGTWEQLGMTPMYKSRYSLKQCTECWALGYHCVLFDVEAFKTCPVHKCPLTKYCFGCALGNVFTPRSKGGFVNRRVCLHCRRVLPERSDLLEFARKSGPHLAEFEQCCRSIGDWWKTVGVNFADRDSLCSELFWVGDGHEKLAAYRDFQLGRATQVVGKPAESWKFSFDAVAVRYAALSVEWDIRIPEQLDGNNDQQGIRDSLGLHYRALRKYLFKTFVRPHRRCLNTLMSLDRHESMSLNGDGVCIPCLAFLTWRMAIEGTIQIEALRLPRRDNFRLRTMFPKGLHPLPHSASLRWCYFSFFGIWQRIEEYSGALGENFRIALSSSYADGNVHWASSRLDCTDNTKSNSQTCVKLSVLYPDLSNRVDTSLANCKQRRSLGKKVIDPQYARPDLTWIGDSTDFTRRDCMFQVRFCEREGIPKFFRYISV